jgi:hypothetical protein
LAKTFWGWREQQLPDGTLILTSPGSALVFPSLGRAAATCPLQKPTPTRHRRQPPTVLIRSSAIYQSLCALSESVADPDMLRQCQF